MDSDAILKTKALNPWVMNEDEKEFFNLLIHKLKNDPAFRETLTNLLMPCRGEGKTAEKQVVE